MKHISKTGLFFLLVIITLFIVFYNTYSRTSQLIGKKSADAFDASITLDMEQRAKAVHLFIMQGYDQAVSDSIDADHFIVESENGRIVHQKPEIHQSLPEAKKANLITQTHLLSRNPICVPELDSLFRMEMKKQGIITQTIVLYSNKQSNETMIIAEGSLSDRLKRMAGYAKVERTTGIYDEITLCGFVKITSAMIFDHSPLSFILLLAGALTAFGMLIHTVIRQKGSLFGSRTATVIPALCPLSDANPPATPIQLDAIERAFMYQDQKIILSGDTFRLFEFIWNKDNYYASYVDISTFLYGNVDIKTGKKRIAQTIKLLRNRLDGLTVVTIENVSCKGYQIRLIIES